MDGDLRPRGGDRAAPVDPARVVLGAEDRSARRWSSSRSRLRGLLWYVFLLVPVATIILAPGPRWPVRAVALVAVIAFGVIHETLTWRWTMAGYEYEQPPRALAVPVLVLLGLTIAALPGARGGTMALLVYLSITFAWQRSRGVSRAAAALCLLAMVVPSFLVEDLWQYTIGPITALLMVTVMDESDRNEHERGLLRREMDRVAERDAISRDVHDLLGHSLTVIALKNQLALRLLDTDPERSRSELLQVQSLTEDAISEVRDTVTGLRTPDLESQMAASRSALETAGVHCRIEGADESVPLERRALMAWALREGTTNVIRHADARRCWIRIARDRLVLTDDGIGMANAAKGNGLAGLARRAQMNGARLEIGTAHSGDALHDGSADAANAGAGISGAGNGGVEDPGAKDKRRAGTVLRVIWEDA